MINNDQHFIPQVLLNPKWRFARHFTVFLLVQSLSLAAITTEPGTKLSLSTILLSWFFYSMVMYVLIYVCAHVLTPRYLETGRYRRFSAWLFVLITGVMVVLGVIQSVYEFFNDTQGEPSHESAMLGMTASFFSLGFFSIGISGIILYRNWLRTTLKVAQLEASTLESELQFLKKQINPHFLFNMLNNANVLVRMDPQQARQVLHKLEVLLRYQIKDSARDAVLLKSDINFMLDYLNLEKIRRDNFSFTVSESGISDNLHVPPLLFITFVENAVKHNPSSGSSISVSFEHINGMLNFRCVNPMPEVVSGRKSVGGLGLANIKRRLELLYGQGFTLHTGPSGGNYTVEMSIPVN